MTDSIKYFVQHLDDARVTEVQREAYMEAIIALQLKEKIPDFVNCATCNNRRKNEPWCDLLDTVVRMDDYCSFSPKEVKK